jgi:adenine-specific DNA-methyltransferase
MSKQGDIVTIGDSTIHQGEALAFMRAMPDNSVDLIATDPPYFKVKGEAWDRQWDNPAKFIEWIGELCEQWQRILRPNGSLYCFASPRMAARVEVAIGERFNVLNRICWAKGGGDRKDGGWWAQASKESLRNFFPQSEYIIFAEHTNADNIAKGESGYGAKCDELRGFVFEPLRAYLAGERDRAGVDNATINAAWCVFKGVNSTSQTQKWFSSSCFNPPTPEAYEWLRQLFNSKADNARRYLCEQCGGVQCDNCPTCNGDGELGFVNQYLTRPYEELRTQYEELRTQYEELRRPFNLTADVPYTDVWTFPTVQAYKGKHPCEKPRAMMRHIIEASSRPGAVVFDCFAGSGSTIWAAHELDRKGIGVDLDLSHARSARYRQGDMFK